MPIIRWPSVLMDLHVLQLDHFLVRVIFEKNPDSYSAPGRP